MLSPRCLIDWKRSMSARRVFVSDPPDRRPHRRGYGQPWRALLPDTFSPEFAAEARRQSLIVANSPHAEEDQAFVDSISHWPE